MKRFLWALLPCLGTFIIWLLMDVFLWGKHARSFAFWEVYVYFFFGLGMGAWYGAGMPTSERASGGCS
jgi:hypothetical protein